MIPESYKLTPGEIAEHYHNEDGLYVYAKEVADHASEKAYEQGKRDERERILKLYEDMGCVPEEESCWYSFWQAIGGDSIPESLKETK